MLAPVDAITIQPVVAHIAVTTGPTAAGAQMSRTEALFANCFWLVQDAQRRDAAGQHPGIDGMLPELFSRLN